MREHTIAFSPATAEVGSDYDRDKNDERIDWAGAAVQTYTQLTRSSENDLETQLTDLLGSLQHWAADNRVSFDEALNRGTRFYIEEQHQRRWSKRAK